eukprot:3360026-Alexandrium_andersonii.AAC.1
MSRTARPAGCWPGPARSQASAAGPSSAWLSCLRRSASRKAVGGSVRVPSRCARTRDTFSRQEPPRLAACHELK